MQAIYTCGGVNVCSESAAVNVFSYVCVHSTKSKFTLDSTHAQPPVQFVKFTWTAEKCILHLAS